MRRKKGNSNWHITSYDSLGRPVYSKYYHQDNSQSNHTKNNAIGTARSEFHGDNRSDVNLSDVLDNLINDELYHVFTDLHTSGITPMIVGGTVRDIFLHKTNKDIDVELHHATSIQQFTEILKQNNVHFDEVGKAFGVIKATVGGDDIDFSFPRRDSKGTGANAHTAISIKVDTTMTPQEAASRRDFTVNSMMIDGITGELVDCYHGLDDLHSGILRAVDKHTFTDDPLRVLRGVQFAGRFDMQMDNDTRELCATMSPDGLSKERIAGELRKILLKSTNFHRSIEEINHIGGSWKNLLKSTNWDAQPADQHIIDSIYQQNITDDEKAGLVASYVDAHYDAHGEYIHDFMLSKNERKMFRDADITHGDNQIAYSRMIRTFDKRNIDRELLNKIISTVGVTPARDLWDGTSPEPYIITGKTLIDMGMTPSKSFKPLIEKYHNKQDNGEKINLQDVRHELHKEGYL